MKAEKPCPRCKAELGEYDDGGYFCWYCNKDLSEIKEGVRQ